MPKPFKKVSFNKKTPKYAKKNPSKRGRKRVTSTKTSSIKKNSMAIVRLTRQVQSAAQGHYQTNTQRATMVGLSNYTLSPDGEGGHGGPIAFAMNDFTSRTQQNIAGGRLWGISLTGVSPGIINTPFIVGQWGTYNPSYDQGMAPAYRQWSDSNKETASLVAYSPISASYNLTFNRESQSDQQQDTFIRIDIIQPKRQYLDSVFHDHSMPAALGSFQSMAINNADGVQNKFNPALWKVQTKYLKLPKTMPSGQAMANQSRTLKLYKSFNRKSILLNLDKTTVANTYEDFVFAVDPKSIPWCVISISNKADTTSTPPSTPVTCHFQRVIRYRDAHGVAQ